MQVRTSQRNGTKGEIGTLLFARADLQLWRAAFAKMRNFVPLLQGPSTRRGGTQYMDNAGSQGQPGNLIDFIYNRSQSYVLEFGELALRFWQGGGRVTSGGVPYEIASPYSAAQSRSLSWARSRDVMFFAGGDQKPRQLIRRGQTNWAFADLLLNDGPFRAPNTDRTWSVSVNVASGSGIMTVSGLGFALDAGHVGALWRLEEDNVALVPEWVGNKPISVGATIRFNRRVYQAVNGGTTSANPPIHRFGNWTDAPAGIVWTYLHDDYGVVRIDSVAGGGLTANVTVLRQIPGANVNVLSWLWSEGAFSPYRGWPDKVLLVEGRLAFFQNTEIYLSAPQDFTTFDLRQGGLALPLVEGDAITWASDVGVLAFGTGQTEHTARASTLREALTADNVLVRTETDEGGAPIRAVRAGRAVLFVAADGERLCEFVYDLTTEGYGTSDLSIESPEMLSSGVVDVAFSRDPHRTVWLACADGLVAALTYRRDQEINAWSLHDYSGGKVESVCAIPSPDGRAHDVWMIVARQIGGATKRYIERQARPYLPRPRQMVPVKPWLLDCALRYEGAPVAAVSGLAHLNGQTVAIYADGSMQSSKVVVAGQVALDYLASDVLVGLDYSQISILQTLPLQVDMGDGPVTARKKRVRSLAVHVDATAACEASHDGVRYEELMKTAGGSVHGARQNQTGILDAPMAGGHDKLGQIMLRPVGALPLTILEIAPIYDVGN
jgi:hypothetical protein